MKTSVEARQGKQPSAKWMAKAEVAYRAAAEEAEYVELNEKLMVNGLIVAYVEGSTAEYAGLAAFRYRKHRDEAAHYKDLVNNETTAQEELARLVMRTSRLERNNTILQDSNKQRAIELAEVRTVLFRMKMEEQEATLAQLYQERSEERRNAEEKEADA